MLRLVAEVAEQRGNLRLAQSILESLSRLAVGAKQKGRLMADRARNARKRGDFALAMAQCEELLRLGRRSRLAELQAAALVGLGALAQVRGNFVEMKSLATRALRIARRHGLDRLAAAAHGGLGVQAAVVNDLNAAITHLWAAYRLSVSDLAAQQELLANLAHTLLLAGRPAEARRASRAALVGSPSIRIALPALGALALAAASLDERGEVDWAEHQARRLAKSRGHVREVAASLADCASALDLIGQFARAGVLRRRAEVLAIRNDFFDLTFQASLMGDRAFSAQVPLGRRATVAALEVEQLELDELPSTLELAAFA